MMNIPRLAASAVLALAMGSTAQAEHYTFSTYLAPTQILSMTLHKDWAEAIRQASNGEIDIEVFYGGALLPATGTLAGIAAGTTQGGNIPAAYHPSELPVANLAGELGFIYPDPYVLGFAFTDFSMNDPLGYDELMRNGVIPMASWSSPDYNLICRDVYATSEELKGKKIRTPGGVFSRFVDDFGMVSVAVSFAEAYTGLERGALDCIAIDVTHLIDGAGFAGLTKSVYMAHMSPSYNSIHIALNKDFWQGLSEAQRRLVLDQTAIAMANTYVATLKGVGTNIEGAKAQGIQFFEPDQQMKDFTGKWVTTYLDKGREDAIRKLGVKDPDAIYSTMNTYIDKWKGLMEGVDRADPAAVTKLLQDNLYGRIDAATYGLQ